MEYTGKRIGVLCGGSSHERPGSLISGAAVMGALTRLQYRVTEIDPSRVSVKLALQDVDRVFIALHGWFGEDGKLQGYLETIGMPYTGSGVLASAVGMDKIAFKRVLKSAGILTPKYAVFDSSQPDLVRRVEDVLRYLSLPIVVKPCSGGGSLGVVIARSLQEVIDAAHIATIEFGSALLEEYIEGDFLTVGLLGSYQKPHFLEILRVTMKGGFYDYEAKHSKGRAEYQAPAILPAETRREAEAIVAEIYRMLGCHGPLRVDMILRESKELYVLEVNTVPGLSSEGNLARIAAAVDISYDQLIQKILDSCGGKPAYVP